jgi:hypothetical protein
MYAHPGFCRDAPEGLLKLRKITSTNTTSSSVHGKNNVRRRAVSPTANLTGVECPPMITVHHTAMTTATMVSHPSSPVANTTTQVAASPPVPPKTMTDYTTTTTTFQADSCGSSINNSNNNNNDWGKLDLLAMAMEQEFAKQYQQQQTSSSLSLSRPW